MSATEDLKALFKSSKAVKCEYEHRFIHNYDSGIYCYIKQLTKSYTLPLEINLDSKVAKQS